MKPVVGIARCKEYEPEVVAAAVHKSLKLVGGVHRFVKKGDRVLVKPNLLAAHPPERAVTTHPLIVQAVAEKLLDCGAQLKVGDSPSSRTAQQVADIAGIKQVCDRLKIPIVGLTDPVWKNWPGKYVRKFPVSKLLEDFAVIVNLPKLKTHQFTVYTGAVKNLFGCIPGKAKSSFHFKHRTKENFSGMLLDLYEMIKPELTVMDAVVGMEGPGPSYGTPKHAGLVLAGSDALALDTVATSIVRLERRVPLLRVARKRRMGPAFLANITIKGEEIANVTIPFKGPRFSSLIDFASSRGLSLVHRILSRRPVIDQSVCIACGVCKSVCSVQAITINKAAAINNRTCIRCYCCYEVCPEKAIALKRLL